MAVDASTEKSSWIEITTLGTTVGMIAAAATYAATSKATSAAATASGLTLSALSELAGMGTGALFGNLAGTTVRIVGLTASKTAEESVRQGGIITAAVAGAAAGAAAALTVTIGGHVVKYSIEYGGQISAEVAKKFSEMYLLYRLNGQAAITDASGLVISDTNGDWLCVGAEVADPAVVGAPGAPHEQPEQVNIKPETIKKK
jgi:hypothetical protein